MERYQRHCIDLNPDLVVIAQSVNDMRSGMPLQESLADLETIVSVIFKRGPALWSCCRACITKSTDAAATTRPCIPDLGQVERPGIGRLQSRHRLAGNEAGRALR